MPTIGFRDSILNANNLGGLSGNEIDAYQENNGPLVLGLDDNDNPVERPGGHIGNLLILGYSDYHARLERSILRAIQRLRPGWPPAHSVTHQTEKEYASFLSALSPENRQLIVNSGETDGYLMKEYTGTVQHFIGPKALYNEVLVAHEALQENMAQMERYDLVAPQPEMYHTLHISGLDKLPPQNDKDGIYEMLGQMAESQSHLYGVNLIIYAADYTRITTRLKNNIIICSLHQQSLLDSRNVTKSAGMEVAAPHVGAIEPLGSGSFTPFRF